MALAEQIRDAASGLPPFVIDMHAAMIKAGEKIPYVIEPIAVRGTVTVVVGKHSARKSWLVMLAAAAVHDGRREVAGMPVAKVPALYLDGEMGDRLMARRFRKAGLEASAMFVGDGFKLCLPDDDQQLRELIRVTGAGLVVIDSLRKIAPGVKENDSDEMAPLMGSLALLARDLDVAIVLIHHRSTKPNAAELRGSSAIEDQADAVFALEAVERDPESDMEPARRRLRTIKFRHDEEPPPRWLAIGPLSPLSPFGVIETEAFIDVEKAPRISMAERLVQEIRQIAKDVPADGWSRKQLADAIVIDPRKSSLGEALGILVGREGWTKTGQTSAVRYCPPRGAL